MEFTIATWNIAGGRPIKTDGLFDYADEDINYFADELRKINPDVICLQETHMNDERSVAGELCAMLGGYQIQEMRISPSHVDEQYYFGNALLSKEIPISYTSDLYPYPSFPLFLPGSTPDRHHDKGFQVAIFDFITIINTQMMPLKFLGTPYNTPNGKKFAHEMEEQLISCVQAPFILCGDMNFNDAPSLYPYLLKNMKSALSDGPTRPGGKKSDYIFVPESCKVIANGIVPTNTDHYLCWAKLSI